MTQYGALKDKGRSGEKEGRRGASLEGYSSHVTAMKSKAGEE